MTQSINTHAHDLLNDLNASEGQRYKPETLTRINKADFKSNVADSPDIFEVDEEKGEGAVLIIANDQQPEFAILGAKAAQSAAACLPDNLARHVLVARQTGRWQDKSFAIYTRQKPISRARWLKNVQLRLIKTNVLDWLASVADATKAACEHDFEQVARFKEPCHYLIKDASTPAGLKAQAEQTLRALGDGTWQPTTILQHGDFWSGNVLLGFGWPRSQSGLQHFEIIDWGGSSVTGYPFIDLLRFTRSLAMSERQIAAAIRNYSKAANLPATDLVHYVTIASGHLGLNRGHFPHDRYITATRQLFDRAQRLDQMLQ